MENLVVLDALVAGAKAAKEFAVGLFSTFAQTTVNALKEMDAAKADKVNPVPFTIPTTGWEKDEDAAEPEVPEEPDIEPGEDVDRGANTYPYYYDLAVEGVTAKDVAAIDFTPESGIIARDCGMCCECETIAGKIRIRSATIPEKGIAAEYRINK